jgi:hypothetical protein
MKKALLIAAVLPAALLLFLPVISRGFLTRIALHKAEDLLQTRIELSSASLHLLTGSVVLNNLKIYHPDRKKDQKNEKIADVDKLSLRLNYFPMIFGHMGELVLEMDHPRLVYATTRTGDWELSNRVPLLKKGKGEKRLTPFDIERIVIEEGEVEYRDGKVSSPPTVTKLSDIDLHVRNVRLPTPKNPLPAKFEGEMTIQKAGKFEIEGRGDFLSPKISFEAEVRISSLPLPPFAPYYEPSLPVRVRRGVLAMKSRAKCEKDYLNAPAHVVVSKLEVEPKGGKIFGFASDRVVQSLKDKKGNVELDILIAGNIRSPQFHLASDLSGAFVKGFSQGLMELGPGAIEEFGKGVKEGAGSGLEKLRGIFR